MEKAIFTITVLQDNEFDDVTVEIRPSRGARQWGYWKSAAEYMLHRAAQRSRTGYEKAFEIMLKGAMTYKDIT